MSDEHDKKKKKKMIHHSQMNAEGLKALGFPRSEIVGILAPGYEHGEGNHSPDAEDHDGDPDDAPLSTGSGGGAGGSDGSAAGP